MPPTPVSKDLEEVINNIQAQLMPIQSQLEDYSSRQSILEAKNDHLHSTFTSLLDQLTTISHSENKLSTPPKQPPLHSIPRPPLTTFVHTRIHATTTLTSQPLCHSVSSTSAHTRSHPTTAPTPQPPHRLVPPSSAHIRTHAATTFAPQSSCRPVPPASARTRTHVATPLPVSRSVQPLAPHSSPYRSVSPATPSVVSFRVSKIVSLAKNQSNNNE